MGRTARRVARREPRCDSGAMAHSSDDSTQGDFPSDPRTALDAREQALLDEIRRLRVRNEALEQSLVDLTARLAQIERVGHAVANEGAPIPPKVSFAAAPTAPPVAPPVAAPTAPPMAPPPVPALITPAATRTGDAERFIGRWIVPIVGALAVMGAVGFLVYYAIDIGLWGSMPPALRFGTGLAIGAAMLAIGELLRRKVPGASVGFDAAGVGTLLVTIAIGVHALRLFDVEVGALLASGAGLFGAAWSVRTRSATVGVCAFLGLFLAPFLYEITQESPLLSGLLFTLAIIAGLAMHALADASARTRFEVLRFCALFAALVGGFVLVARELLWGRGVTSDVTDIGFVLLWFGALVGSAALHAVRGEGRVTNLMVLAIASGGAFLVQLGTWGATATGDLRAWFPSLAGGMLAASGFFLRSFMAPDDPDNARERGEPTTDACRDLSNASLALGLAMFFGGFVHFAPSGGEPLAIAVIAAGLVIAAERTRAIAFDVLGVFVAFIACISTWVTVLGRAVGPSGYEWELPLGTLVTVRWSWEFAGAIVACIVLFAHSCLRVRTSTDTLRVGFAALAWFAPACGLVEEFPFAGALAIPGIVVACMPHARRSIVVAALCLLLPATLLWLSVLFGVFDGSLSSWGCVEISFYGWILMAITAIGCGVHGALGEARRVVGGAALVWLVVSLAALGVVAARAAGTAAVDLTLVFVSITALMGGLFMAVLPRVVVRCANESLVAGSLASVIAAVVGAVHGLGMLFGGSMETPSIAIALVACVAVGSAAVGLRWTRLQQPDFMHVGQTAIAGLYAAAVVPMGAILLAAMLPGGIAVGVGAIVVATWVVLVGVGEITVGFVRDFPALRWGGLLAFVFLVLRLFLVDLAGAPTLVRVALLFVTGLALVGVGIVYARIGRSGTLGEGQRSGRIEP
jgi:hypothetical protein